jgi:uncharacterized protein YbjT (DUF2867 family)
MRALVTGATGFVGERLAERLLDDGVDVRCLVRDRSRARGLEERGAELWEGDVLERGSLAGIGRDVDVAYYLIHSMGRGNRGDFVERERRAAAGFAEATRDGGVGRTVYLGGLGDGRASRHLRARYETAAILKEKGPPLTHFRAGMVVGRGSESYRTLRYLVERLPVMIAPAWLSTKTQPIGIDDVLAYLAQAPGVEESTGREVQIGGPDVLSYAEMLDEMADALGRPHRPRLSVPLLTPWLSSLWIGLVTPVDAGVVRPLIESLSSPTVVTDPEPARMFPIEPRPLTETLHAALAEERDEPAAAPASLP